MAFKYAFNTWCYGSFPVWVPAYPLDEVIRRHGGEALKSRQAYESLSESEREDLLAFLGGLVLYSTETLPTDVDGDGVVSEHFVVAGVEASTRQVSMVGCPCAGGS